MNRPLPQLLREGREFEARLPQLLREGRAGAETGRCETGWPGSAAQLLRTNLLSVPSMQAVNATRAPGFTEPRIPQGEMGVGGVRAVNPPGAGGQGCSGQGSKHH